MKDADCVDLLRWALPRLGLRWPGFRTVRRQVCRRIDARMHALAVEDGAAYRTRLEADPGEWTVLDSMCRISISRFLRDRGVWECLVREVLPTLAHSAVARGERELRAWSAGCASGEEPYGLSIAWELEMQPQYPGLSLRIVASDADARLLERARRGCYAASSLREVPESWRLRAFEERNGVFHLRARFRERVELCCEDVRVRQPAGRFDLVLCRNLGFTYFDEARQRELLVRIAERLRAGGALMIGRHELLPGDPRFAPWPNAPGIFRCEGFEGAA